MSRTDNVWSASISGHEDGLKVYYYVEAIDKAGNQKDSSIYYYEVSKASSSITCSVSKTNMTLGEELTVSGSISPFHADVTVTLIYTMPDGSTIDRTVITASDGSFRDTYTPDAGGLWSVEASWAGDWDHKGAKSPSAFFSVEETVKLPPKASFIFSAATNLSLIVTINFEDISTDPMAL